MDYSVKTHLTRDDIIRSGACIDGVDQVISRKKILMTSAPVDYLLSVVGVNNIEYVTEAAGRSGYGDGDGDGDGYGSGYGDGDGDGYGYGSGYGDGDGDGYGYGSGYGDGDGYGYGSGYGDGDGYGYSYGDG